MYGKKKFMPIIMLQTGQKSVCTCFCQHISLFMYMLIHTKNIVPGKKYSFKINTFSASNIFLASEQGYYAHFYTQKSHTLNKG
jgi:hypothetical protein